MATFPVTASGDDYWCSLPSTFIANSSIRIGGSLAVPQIGGCLFRNVTIPPGATITSAFVRFVGHATDTNDGDNLVSLEAADNPAVPTTASDADGRTRTTANVTWVTPAPVAGVVIDTPDFTAAMQEVVDRGGWASGNNVHLLIDRVSGTNDVQLASWDHGTYAEPVLHVEWDSDGHLSLTSTSHVDTPDIAGHTFTDPLDVRVDVRAKWITHTPSEVNIFSKNSHASPEERSWALGVQNGTHLRAYIDEGDGVWPVLGGGINTASHGLVDDERVTIRLLVTQDDGASGKKIEVFKRAGGQADNKSGTGWTSLLTWTEAGTFTLPDNTIKLAIGAMRPQSPIWRHAHDVYHFVMLQGTDGTTIHDLDLRTGPDITSTRVDAQGHTWTVQGTGWSYTPGQVELAATAAGVATVTSSLTNSSPSYLTLADNYPPDDLYPDDDLYPKRGPLGWSTVTSTLLAQINPQANPSGVASVTAAVTLLAPAVNLAATSNGISTATASIQTSPQLAATSAGTSTVTASTSFLLASSPSGGTKLYHTRYVLSGVAGERADSPNQTPQIDTKLRIEVKVALDDWTPAVVNTLAAQGQPPGTADWVLYVTTDGRLDMTYDGSADDSGPSQTLDQVATNGSPIWVAVDADVTGDFFDFWWSDDTTDDPASVTWSQFGVRRTVAMGAHTPTVKLTVGNYYGAAFPASGAFYAVRVLVDGEVIYDIDFTDITSSEATAGWFIEDSDLAGTITLVGGEVEGISPRLSLTRVLAATPVGTSTVTSALTLNETTLLAATPAGSSTVAAVLQSPTLLATSTGISTVTSSPTLQHLLAATSTGISTVTSTLDNQLTNFAAATPAGTSTVTSAATQTNHAATTITPVATVTASILNAPQFTAYPAAKATVAPTLTQTNNHTATVTGTASIAADLTLVAPVAATITGAATVTASTTTTYGALPAGSSTATASVTIERTLSASPSGVSSVSAFTSSTFIASTNGTTTISGALHLEHHLSAAPTNTSTVAADLTHQTVNRAAATIAGSSTTSAAITVVTVMSASTNGISTATSSLNVEVPLAASINAGATTTGDLAAVGPALDGFINATGSVVAAVTVISEGMALPSGLAGVSAGLTVINPLSASPAGSASISATTGTLFTPASSVGAATVLATIHLTIQATASPAGVGSLTSSVHQDHNLACVLNGQAVCRAESYNVSIRPTIILTDTKKTFLTLVDYK